MILFSAVSLFKWLISIPVSVVCSSLKIQDKEFLKQGVDIRTEIIYLYIKIFNLNTTKNSDSNRKARIYSNKYL